MEGARRVPVEQYRQNLETLVAQARARQVDVAVLTPCNRPLLTEGAPQTGWPWDAYFDALEELSQQHGLVLVRGCRVARSAALHPEHAFLDEMHPTAVLNQAYGDAVADALIAAGWPASPP
jgi:lysophospholipase L1-like esterase